MGKKKKPAVPAAVPVQPAAPAAVRTDRADWRDRVFPWLFPPLLFLAVAAQGGRVAAIGLTAVFLIMTVGRGGLCRLRERATPLLLAVFAYALLCFAASLYSDFGESAMREAAKILSAFVLFALVILRAKREFVRELLLSIAGCCAIFSLLSIDGSSWGAMTRGFVAFMKLFQVDYDLSTLGYETGVRITGIFSNANITGGLLAFALLLGLYLLRTAESPRERTADYLMLGVNALGFFLSFSMGAIAAFAISCLVYLLTAGKGERLPLFLRMAAAIIVTGICAAAAYPCLGKSGAISLLPLILAFACGGLLLAADRLCAQKLCEKLAGREKAVGIAVASIAGAFVLYAVLALNVTGGTTLPMSQTLSRAAYLSAGDYTAQTDSDGSAAVAVYSQNESELMMHTRTELYSGALSSAAFTVPEGARVVWFDFSAEQGDVELRRVTLSDGTGVRLGYPLLPGFVANRLQALRANQNVVQRFVYYRDGLRLWEKSPLTGFGLSAVEGRLTSVQSFYYETKYIHNQFIQVLDETGLLGLAVYLAMLLSAIVLLACRRRKEREPIFAVLCACVTLMIAHSLTEVVWSTQMYQTVAFLIFAALILQYGEPVRVFSRKALSAILACLLWIYPAVSAAMLGGVIWAGKEMNGFQAASRTEFLDEMEKLVRLDCYTDETYKVNYIGNAIQTDNNRYRSRAAVYAQQLRDSDEYTACSDAAQYYFLPLGKLSEMFDASRAAIEQEGSNPDAWNHQIEFYRSALDSLSADNMEDYLTGVQATSDYLESFNADRMQPIELTEENQKFLNEAASIREQGLSADDTYTLLHAAAS